MQVAKAEIEQMKALNPAAKAFTPPVGAGSASGAAPPSLKRATRVLYSAGVPLAHVQRVAHQCGDVRAIHPLAPNVAILAFFNAKHAYAAVCTLLDTFGPGVARFAPVSECPSAPDNQGSVVVFNLPPDTDNESIASVFNQFGSVREVRETPSKRSHRFVEFWDARDAERALNSMHKRSLFGRIVNVEFAKPGGGGAREREVLQQQQQQQQVPAAQMPSASASAQPSDSSTYTAESSGSTHGSSETSSVTTEQAQPHQTNEALPYSNSMLEPDKQSIYDDRQPPQAPQSFVHQGIAPTGQPPAAAHSTPTASAAAPPNQVGYGMPMHPAAIQVVPDGTAIPTPVMLAPFPAMHSCAAPAAGVGTHMSTANGIAAQQVAAEQHQHQPAQQMFISNGSKANLHASSQQPHPQQAPHQHIEYQLDQLSIDDGRRLSPQMWGLDASGTPRTHTPASISQWYTHGIYAFSREEAARPDGRTTLMIRNIPNQMDKGALIAELDDRGFVGDWDVLYLPVDCRNGCNLGYAFINMRNPAASERLFDAFHTLRWVNYKTRKVAEVTYARLQGKQALLAHFNNSGKRQAEALPVLSDEDGNRESVSPPPLSQQNETRPEDA